MKTKQMIPMVAAAALAIGATGYAATNAIHGQRSDARSSVTPPVHVPAKPPTPASATVVTGVTGTSIRVRLPGKHGKLVTVKLGATTTFFRAGKRIALSSIKPGHRIVVKWRRTKTGFVVVRVIDLTPVKRIQAGKSH